MATQEQDRTEQATPFKLQEARKRGQVAKSLDFNSFVMVATLVAAALIWGESLWQRVAVLDVAISSTRLSPLAGAGTYVAGVRLFVRAVVELVAPVAALAVLFAILANFVQTGPIFSFEPLKPKLERINPVAGFKRVYNKRMLFEALKSVLKLVLFVAIIAAFFMGVWPRLPELGTLDTRGQLGWFVDQSLALAFRMLLAMAVVGLLDLLYVRWTFRRQMMMSKRELKEEIKRREGDPLIRAKIRALQRENLKQSKSLSRVPDADVLITNPVHFAVALRYVRGAMSAPHVVSKGSEAWAVEMKETAARHGVPIVERPALARRLFRGAAIDGPVPGEMFVEVARVYADLDAERRARAVSLEVRS